MHLILEPRTNMKPNKQAHRIYVEILNDILTKTNVMLFIMGARQVGKTTISKLISINYDESIYLNWDVDEHRELIISGQKFIEKIFPLNRVGQKPLIIFDEIHKYKNWKNYIKGFYDLYKDDYKIIVTGSSHLDIFQKGGDSLMGRYIPFSINPFSIGELNPNPLNSLTKEPHQINDNDLAAMYKFGGYPTPFIEREEESYNRWKNTRKSQLFREDIRDLTHIHEISQLELCAQILSHQCGSILNRSSISKKLKVSIQTISRWVETLKQFYYAFTIQPYTTNIPNSLIKEPKIYLNDWSLIEDPGAGFENFVACHLKKSIDFWNEHGKGEFGMYFLRDKKQREADFLITKDGKPWFIVEAKTSEQGLTSSLHYYKEHTGAPFAFQVTKNMKYIDYDCFSKEGIFIVPSSTFLSQLV